MAERLDRQRRYRYGSPDSGGEAKDYIETNRSISFTWNSMQKEKISKMNQLNTAKITEVL
jgi:hypothetical protein